MGEDELELMLLGPADPSVLDNVADGVFDNPIEPAQLARFLESDAHLIVVAVIAGQVVGMATGVIYLHPDKPPQLWINEVGVGDGHRRRGVAKRLLRLLIAQGRSRGCAYAWLGTEADNDAARQLYRSVGGAETTDMVIYEWPAGSGIRTR